MKKKIFVLMLLATIFAVPTNAQRDRHAVSKDSYGNTYYMIKEQPKIF